MRMKMKKKRMKMKMKMMMKKMMRTKSRVRLRTPRVMENRATILLGLDLLRASHQSIVIVWREETRMP